MKLTLKNRLRISEKKKPPKKKRRKSDKEQEFNLFKSASVE